MPVLRVAVDEIGKDEPLLDVGHLPLDLLHPIVVVGGVDGGRDAPARKEIFDFPDRHDGPA